MLTFILKLLGKKSPSLDFKETIEQIKVHCDNFQDRNLKQNLINISQGNYLSYKTIFQDVNSHKKDLTEYLNNILLYIQNIPKEIYNKENLKLELKSLIEHLKKLIKQLDEFYQTAKRNSNKLFKNNKNRELNSNFEFIAIQKNILKETLPLMADIRKICATIEEQNIKGNDINAYTLRKIPGNSENLKLPEENKKLPK